MDAPKADGRCPGRVGQVVTHTQSKRDEKGSQYDEIVAFFGFRRLNPKVTRA